MNELYLTDCMDFMKDKPDNFYELAIVDPPYGIGIAKNPVRQQHDKKEWDNAIPKKEYFNNLFRISKNQIIWGANYFLEYLPNTQGFLIWDKKQPENFSLAMCELAFSSIQSPSKMFRFSVLKEKGKIHPTQKPIDLYKWIISKYAKPGDKILDTHSGSGSLRIACHDLGFDIDSCEIDLDYYRDNQARFKKHIQQNELFDTKEYQEIIFND